MKFIALLLLTLPLQRDDLTSPDGRFQIVMYGKDLGDSSYELNYYLKQIGQSDSTLLTSSFIHDLLAPVFWWTPDSRLLIYEHKEEGKHVSMVKVMDMKDGKVRFSSKGFINAQMNKKNKFLVLDGYLLYFKSPELYKVQLLKLNLSNYETEQILEFENYGVYETPQITIVNKREREITLTTLGKNYEAKEILVKL
ncbi:hypothetical protein GCM10009122_39000 [Fulvivirga kasyanovii]|uniref:S9 family peptidase n=1 Tax=Fulvivirga kasyanovii TaxID=396812 RepID=A0ABW9RTV4_9BACT|nr:hypothetical protein [Fulvivirga kasyanovii]MTI27637.1 hypothetical protein [Fulvivirga kasyanovii]